MSGWACLSCSGAAALVFLALQSANLLQLNFQTGYRVTARFDNIGGLKPKAAVRSAGVVVGRVESITFDDKTFQARVTLELDKQLRFPQGQLAEDSDQRSAGRAIHRHRSGADEKIWRRVTTLRPRSLPWCWKT
jgi:phospholipid/cholesterol/gamma-HCH transport system substrate-binding protein